MGRAACKDTGPPDARHPPSPSDPARHTRPRRGHAAARTNPPASGPMAVVARPRGAGSGSALAGVRAPLRSGAHVPLPQADTELDHASPPAPGARSLDLARARCLHTAPSRAQPRGGPTPALGATDLGASIDAVPSAARLLDSPDHARHPGEHAETPRPVTWAAKRATIRSCTAPPGAQEGRLNASDLLFSASHPPCDVPPIATA